MASVLVSLLAVGSLVEAYLPPKTIGYSFKNFETKLANMGSDELVRPDDELDDDAPLRATTSPRLYLDADNDRPPRVPRLRALPSRESAHRKKAEPEPSSPAGEFLSIRAGPTEYPDLRRAPPSVGTLVHPSLGNLVSAAVAPDDQPRRSTSRSPSPERPHHEGGSRSPRALAHEHEQIAAERGHNHALNRYHSSRELRRQLEEQRKQVHARAPTCTCTCMCTCTSRARAHACARCNYLL